jgi:hypothetical protein
MNIKRLCANDLCINLCPGIVVRHGMWLAPGTIMATACH